MAFVYRSSSRNNFLDLKPLSLGPGEYDAEISKTEGRLLHQNGIKFSKILKNNKHPQIIPFNTTSQRSPLMKLDYYMPGPGTYTLSQKVKNTNNKSALSLEKEITDIFSPNLNHKGFLSSERRFNSTDMKNISNEKISPGPGSYDLRLEFVPNNKNENKFLKGKYAPNKGKIYTLPGSSEKKISSIPDKTKGKFKIIKGILTEIKNSEKENDRKNPLGPGTWKPLG